jgi:hypothetical protein
MAGLCPGHPPPAVRAQMAGTGPAMTVRRRHMFPVTVKTL